ncbi:GNAT family N-acetyltransferase [Paenarthrobacter sp. Z7-10]|uniref:GNAT family N-acetyltransferase n=1 Tax=Paenarthrobacter sp. Z7-10 TaxID=2787635 RepID=UPI0022A93BD9|nr:GNAT family N-acetyltransferase [Paenarthrobacter sp. Z7-10]MCZ2404074.1 GNAT family N-acetyltransferase [Paenarthrobacter sp. Z7-10]
MSVTRLIAPNDAFVLAELMRANRDFMAPWEPTRTPEFFTESGQRAAIDEVLVRHEQGTVLPHVILDAGGSVVGRITLNGIVRGAFQSCSVGYWVSAAANGCGFATAAVREIKSVAFEDLGLHRIQAETLRHNAGSQRVLDHNGFVRIGMAPAYLKIAGRWQDMDLFQVISPNIV